MNIKRLKTTLGRDIEIIENDEQPERFIKNALTPATIEKVIVKEFYGDSLIVVYNNEEKTVLNTNSAFLSDNGFLIL